MRHEEREKYRLHAKLPIYKRHVEQSLAIVREAIGASGTWAVGLSGGKDSACVLDLCVRAGWKGPAFHFYYEETPAENTSLCVLLADRYGLELQTVKLPGAFDVYEEVGHFFAFAVSDEEKAATRRMLRGYKAGAEEFSQSMGHAGQFWGLRREESRFRAMTVARKGVIYKAGDRRTATCLPVAYWSARDVWAYLIEREIPWLPTYDAADDRERQRSEMTWLACEEVWRRGGGKNLRRQDPELWSRLLQRFPALGEYG